jgi:hypothetical protein
VWKGNFVTLHQKSGRVNRRCVLRLAVVRMEWFWWLAADRYQECTKGVQVDWAVWQWG